MEDEISIGQSGDYAWPDPRREPPRAAAAWGEMIDVMRGFLDTVSGVRPDEATIQALKADLEAWTERLQPARVDEAHQLFARILDQTGRGQTTSPALQVERQEPGDFRGHVEFGRYFLGVNGAAHGGVIALMFDEVLGRAAASTGKRLRTAYLKTDYRALTPLDTRLEVRGWLDRQDGRKHFVRGELRHGDVVCADAEGLFIQLRPEQR